MNELLGKLLGLRELTLDDPDVRLEFVRQWAPWVWAFLLLLAAGFAAWSYWKLIGRATWRTLLAIARTLLLALVLLMLAGPQLVRQSERIEKDWVVVLVDRSSSMTIADAPGATPDSFRTREEQLRNALEAGGPAWREIAANRNILFLGFDAGAYDLRPARTPEGAAPPSIPIELGDPEGRRTSVERAIEQALRRVASRPVAGVVLLSDGRSAEGISRPLLRQIEARQVPIFPVALGSPTPIPDFAVARVEAPAAAFRDDTIPVSIEIEGRGLGEASPEVRVELVDEATGELLAQTTTPVREGAASRVLLTTRAALEGATSWTVRVVPPVRDLSQENNSARVPVNVVDRPIRIVYFDGYPRWEYRYFKNLLVREQSIRSAALLLAADKRFIQEGSDPLTTVPRTSEEWNGVDVVVMGDVRPTLFSDDQLDNLKAHIARRGAGLLWIAGPAATPSAWFGTSLADLLPFTSPSLGSGGSGTLGSAGGQGVGMPLWLKPVVMTPAPAADRYAVLRLGNLANDPWPPEVTNPDVRWSSLRWAQRIEPGTLKPTSETLVSAVAGDPLSAEAESLPLVLTMRYGAGRIIYVGTDEIWRLRYGRGEALMERFYLPLLRMLARDSLGRTGKPAILEATPVAAVVDQRVTITLRVIDEALVASRPDSISLRVDGAGGSADVELRPDPAGEGAAPTAFTGVFLPPQPGTYSVVVEDAAFSGLDLATTFAAALPQDELREPQTDHALLRQLAEASEGKMLDAAQLPELSKLLPNRQVRIVGSANVETLWDKPVVWVLLITLLAAEWIGRRLIRLS